MKRKRTALLAALLGVSLVASAQFFNNFTDLSDEALNAPAGRALLQAYSALKSGYLTQLEDNTLLEGAINGMLESLNDPYTTYGTPEQAELERQDRGGSFEGIGATLQARNQNDGTIVEVVNVYRGSPAEQAGVRIGDIFATIDGKNVRQATTDEVVELVRGEAGSQVRLGLIRSGHERPVQITVTRGSIEIVSVETAILPENVGYIHLTTFANERVFEQLDAALARMERENVGSLILDLRNNGGGLLDQGIRVADEFLTEGDIVFQRAQGVTQRLAEADAAGYTMPMVVLVNRNSASASEIVAGALQDNGRAEIVGEKTFGKGVGQSVISLSNGGQLVYKSFEWLTPDRKSINERGITPDLEVADALVPTVLALEGQGARPGQRIEVIVDGKKLAGRAQIDQDGNFTFVQAYDPPRQSAVQGEALVSLEDDPALQAAHAEVLRVYAQAAR